MRPPSSRARGTTTTVGSPQEVSMIADTAPVNATTDPTDRSMCPVMITSIIPIARIRM